MLSIRCVNLQERDSSKYFCSAAIYMCKLLSVAFRVHTSGCNLIIIPDTHYISVAITNVRAPSLQIFCMLYLHIKESQESEHGFIKCACR